MVEYLQGARKLLWFCVVREMLCIALLLLQVTEATRANRDYYENNADLKRVKIKNLSVPTHVKVGDSAQLTCTWEVEHTQFYLLNWYKDGDRFYSYRSNAGGTKQIHNATGFKVVLQQSDDNVVTLSNLTPEAGGFYKCEVMSEGPKFRLSVANATMIVVRQPEVPKLIGLRERYYINEDLNVTCSAENGSPPPTLTFMINKKNISKESGRVRDIYTPYYRREGGPTVVESQLVMPVGEDLHPSFHLTCFAHYNGKLEVKYITQVRVEERQPHFFIYGGGGISITGCAEHLRKPLLHIIIWLISHVLW